MKKLLTLLLCLLPLSVGATKSNITLADTAVVAAGKVLQVLGRVQADSIFSGNRVVTPLFSSAWTAGKRVRGNLFSLDSLRIVDSLTVAAGSKTKFFPGSIFQAANIQPDTIGSSWLMVPGKQITAPYLDADTLAGGTIATGIFNISTATNFQLAGTAFTGTMTLLNSVTDGSVLTTQHYHSALSASDGSPNPALSVDATGNVFINETSNANSTIGLTINQGANDDEALSLKSSDVVHGITTQAETDTYGKFSKTVASTGGLNIIGFSSAIGGININGFGATDETTHSTAGAAYVQVSAAKANGTGITSPGANANLFLVRDASANTTQFIVDEEGDLYANGTTGTGATVGLYDDYDDVAAISALDKLHAEMSNKKIVDSEWEDFTKYNEQDLIDMHILGGPRVNVPPENRGLINYTGLVRLHNGAIRQLGRSVGETEYRVGNVEQRLAQLEMERLFYSPTIWGRN